jgi:hypothetical protein
MQFIWLGCKKINDMMAWWNDATQQTINSHGYNENNWRASGASIPGCYNSPPLTRDLAPRSKNEKRKRRGNHKLLLGQMSGTKESWEDAKSWEKKGIRQGRIRNHSGWGKIDNEWERRNSVSTLVEKRCKNLIRWKEFEKRVGHSGEMDKPEKSMILKNWMMG